jgi:hypothetical protein
MLRAALESTNLTPSVQGDVKERPLQRRAAYPQPGAGAEPATYHMAPDQRSRSTPLKYQAA